MPEKTFGGFHGGGQTQTLLKNMGMSLQSYLIRYKFKIWLGNMEGAGLMARDHK
jgi:hypothetical protein